MFEKSQSRHAATVAAVLLFAVSPAFAQPLPQGPKTKVSKFDCTEALDPVTQQPLGLSAPTSFVVSCAPRAVVNGVDECPGAPVTNRGCTSPPTGATYTTRVFPPGTHCNQILAEMSSGVGAVPAGPNPVTQPYVPGPGAEGLNFVCDGLNAQIGSNRSQVQCNPVFGDPTQLQCRSHSDYCAFDVCVEGEDLVDTIPNPDVDFVSVNGIALSGSGKRKFTRDLPVLGSWGLGGLSATVLAVGAALAQRKRSARKSA